jgi:hypothetical protein
MNRIVSIKSRQMNEYRKSWMAMNCLNLEGSGQVKNKAQNHEKDENTVIHHTIVSSLFSVGLHYCCRVIRRINLR